MKVKTHIAVQVSSMFAGVVICFILFVFNVDNMETAGYPTELILFISIVAGGIIPNLFFKFIMRPNCPKCGKKGKYVWHRSPKRTEFICKNCGYVEETMFSLKGTVG
jgi:hypothetical protein